MSDKIKDGGAAFPIPNVSDMDGYVYAADASGMTLRDWFAGQALAGLINDGNAKSWPSRQQIAAAAGYAYQAADAMLRAREREGE